MPGQVQAGDLNIKYVVDLGKVETQGPQKLDGAKIRFWGWYDSKGTTVTPSMMVGSLIITSQQTAVAVSRYFDVGWIACDSDVSYQAMMLSDGHIKRGQWRTYRNECEED